MQQAKSDSLLVKAILLLASTLTVMAGATIAPSLPAMEKHFSQIENVKYLVRLILTVPALFIAIGGPIVGATIDRLGRKPLLIISTCLYALAGSSGLVLDSLSAILVGRALLGLSVAGVMTSVTTLIADYYTGEMRFKFMGLQASFMALGGVVFLSVGGVLADINWRGPFAVYLFAAILLPPIAWLLYEPDDRQKNDSLDSPERKSASQPEKLWKLLAPIYGLAIVQMLVFYLIPVQLPFHLQALSNASATQSGLAIATCTLASAVSSLLYGRLKARLNFIAIIALSASVAGIGYAIIGLAPDYHTVLVGLIITGLGFGLMMPNLTVWLSGLVPPQLRGRALGGLTTFFFLGQFLSPIVTQPAINSIGLGNTYSFAGGLLLLMGLILILPRK